MGTSYLGFKNDLPILSDYGVKAFIGGCHKRGVGSKFRAKAHAHKDEKIICFRSGLWLHRRELLIHELAHVLTSHSHDDRWRAKVLELGGVITEVPGLLKSYEKRKKQEAI